MNLRLGLLFGFLGLALFSLLTFSACQAAPAKDLPSTVDPTQSILPSSSPTSMIPTAPAKPPTQDETISPSPEATPPSYTALCSPLEGETLADLSRPDLLKNPFQPPRPGDDGGHFGVDFAYWTRSDGTSMLGLPIYSVLDGVVASTIHDRQPYGNALIIETPLEQIDPLWRSSLPIQAYDLSAPLQPSTSLTCPPYDFTPPGSRLSIYLLYAHMQQPTRLQPGSRVTCGQSIGQVGTTGNSVNPHLHLETRIGPSGVQFTSLAHYDTSATREEMRNYCLWRLSGAFMPLDPMLLLSSTSSH